jgi:hypothetical protein
MERETYMRRTLQDHLLDEATYKRLSQEEAEAAINASMEEMKQLIHDNLESSPEHEITYFKRALL